MKSQHLMIGIAAASTVLGTAFMPPLAQKVYSLAVDRNRWLEVRQVVGDVRYYRNGRAQSATANQSRLQQVGDRLVTGARSRTVLAMDTNIGFIDVAENTDLRVETLNITSSGGRVTRLNVTRGQARLRVRQFTDPQSSLEIRTPAGVSAVRGTEFGISVNPDGQTGVLTESGQVTASAEGITVTVDAGFQSLIVPGEPPTPPTPITDNVELDIIQLEVINSGTEIHIMGQIDPLSQVSINDETLAITPEGKFELVVPRPRGDRIPATVSTLAGRRQKYELAIP